MKKLIFGILILSLLLVYGCGEEEPIVVDTGEVPETVPAVVETPNEGVEPVQMVLGQPQEQKVIKANISE